jgi:integrase
MSWAPSPIGLPDQPDVAARIGAYALFLHTAAAARPRQFGCVHRILIVKTETGKRRKFWLTQETADVLKRLPPKRIAKGRHKGELRVLGYAHCVGPIDPRKKTPKRAGLAYVTPYEAGRHSFATQGVTLQNQNVVMVAKVWDWADTRTC